MDSADFVNHKFLERMQYNSRTTGVLMNAVEFANHRCLKRMQ